MLKPRIIPLLLIKNNGLVKTVNFNEYKYVGDPINAVKIFNEKEVDEIIVSDIDASKQNREPNYELIKKIAEECRMPLCYVGGVKNEYQAEKIFNLGVEKIGISSAAINDINILEKITNKVGKQSVVLVIDVKINLFGKYIIHTLNGTINTKLNLIDFIKKINTNYVGEIVINSIDKDGKMSGYDKKLISQTCNMNNLPITYIGGASSYEEFIDILKIDNTIGLSAGSIFVFKGKYKAVLINYPDKNFKSKLYNSIL